MRYQRILFLLCSLFFFHISFSQTKPTSITWDEWGVPHIYASTDEELMYAEGWAHMYLHANLIVELYGKSRGKAAEYWGKDKLPDDMMINTLGFPELAEEWTAKQDPEYKKMVTAYVKGLNAYVNTHPDAVKPENRIILPLTEIDVNLHALFVIYGRFVGGQELGMTQEWKEMGSNTWAIGPSHSASHKAMLVQNPHLPWYGEFLFTESHLVTPGHNIYGSGLVGLPGIAIAFNENLGWSHTNNTIDNADTYQLQLKDGGYMLDSVRKDFTVRKKMLHYKDENGKMVDQELTILSTVHGPVVKMGKNKALAIRMPGYDRPNAGLQWWKMANAANFNEFESALKMAQIPFWNVMYADKEGNIFYLFNGLVPKRSSGNWGYWNRIIPGGKSADVWTEVHPYADLPKVKNPASGWLQNTNDPPWSSTFPNVLKASDFPAYMSPKYMDFRTQRSVHMLEEDQSITFKELEEDKLSTRLEMADRILDDLFKAIDQYGTDLSKEAKTVLEKWDRKADNKSEGTLLFVRWAHKMKPYDQRMYAVKWDEKNPEKTPDGLADPKAAVAALDQVAAKIKTDFGSLSVPWGQVFRARSRTLNLPGNGADGSVGSFRVAWPGDEENNITNIGGGDSWVGIIEFGEKVKARVLLSYGNSTQDNDPHNGDQLKLFSEKKLRDAYFYPKDVEAHKVKREVLMNGIFVAE
jgi:acyl-homoserine-lactone acylase